MNQEIWEQLKSSKKDYIVGLQLSRFYWVFPILPIAKNPSKSPTETIESFESLESSGADDSHVAYFI